jgi:hypothetical protein
MPLIAHEEMNPTVGPPLGARGFCPATAAVVSFPLLRGWCPALPEKIANRFVEAVLKKWVREMLYPKNLNSSTG